MENQFKNEKCQSGIIISELMKEIAELKKDNEVLHNIIENQNAMRSLKCSNNEGGYTENEFKELERGYNLHQNDYAISGYNNI